ncbi:hypothetical protein OOJ96_18090 [Pseudomonas sp. 15FMM2]|uniref:Uncharacterized protein n=1 Tax=Pseudomonas imrae TaxID=2992837 RepID=A0ACC7PGC8_9PSED
MDSLEQFVMSLGAEIQRAQQACDRLWPGTQVASLNMVVDATVEPVGEGLALRVGGTRTRGQRSHALSLEVPGCGNEAIVVRVDGELLGIYRRPGDEQAQ